MLYFIKNLFINKNEKLVVNGGDLNISLYSDILNELSIIYNKVEVMNLFFDKWKKFEFGKGYDNTLFENQTIEQSYIYLLNHGYVFSPDGSSLSNTSRNIFISLH